MAEDDNKKHRGDLDEFGLLERREEVVEWKDSFRVKPHQLKKSVPRVKGLTPAKGLDEEMIFDTCDPKLSITMQVTNIGGLTTAWAMTLFGHVDNREEIISSPPARGEKVFDASATWSF